jgi:precorrin-4 methylase
MKIDLFKNLAKFVRIMALFTLCSLVIVLSSMASAADDGKLYLVGMGPGDPDLATVRAVNVLESADYVYCFDYLSEILAHYVSADVINVAPRLLIKKFYGRDPSQFSGLEKSKCKRSQAKFKEFAEQIRGLLKEGKTIVIADAGDPLIFGPWAWITEEFADLSPVVVPGISSFNAGNAALGKDVFWGSRTVILTGDGAIGRVITEKAKNPYGLLPTLVYFTHKTDLNEIVDNLLGTYSPDTPVRIVCNAGMREKETIISATLGTILEKTKKETIPFLNLVYVGDTLVIKHKKSDK